MKVSRPQTRAALEAGGAVASAAAIGALTALAEIAWSLPGISASVGGAAGLSIAQVAGLDSARESVAGLALFAALFAVLTLAVNFFRRLKNTEAAPLTGGAVTAALIASFAAVFFFQLSNAFGAAPAFGLTAFSAAAAAFAFFRLRKKPAGKAWEIGEKKINFALVVATPLGLALLATATFTRFCEPGFPAPRPGPGGKNVVLIALDTVRADRLSAHGHSRKTTPAIDELASSGVMFERAYTPSPWTLPSHASMFTGLYPSEHRAINGNRFLDDEIETLAEALQKRGYATLGFSANPWVSDYTNLDQGFDVMVHPRGLAFADARFSGEALLRAGKSIVAPLRRERDSGAAEAAARFGEWTERAARERRPFFIFVNLMEAHLPYPEADLAFSFFADADQARREIEAARFNWMAYDAGYSELDPRTRELYRTWYDGSIRYLDYRVGEMLAALDRHGLRQDTVVIVTSDHGEGLGDHGMWGHEFGMHHELLHVPLVIDRGENDRLKISRPFSLLGMKGLALDLAAGKEPGVFTDGEPGREDVLYAERFAPRRFIARVESFFPAFEEERMDRDQRSALSFPYHYIRDSRGDDLLFDLEKDPAETVNLIDQAAAVRHELDLLISAFIADHPPLVPVRTEEVIDLDALERLRALGYIK